MRRYEKSAANAVENRQTAIAGLGDAPTGGRERDAQVRVVQVRDGQAVRGEERQHGAGHGALGRRAAHVELRRCEPHVEPHEVHPDAQRAPHGVRELRRAEGPSASDATRTTRGEKRRLLQCT